MHVCSRSRVRSHGGSPTVPCMRDKAPSVLHLDLPLNFLSSLVRGSLNYTELLPNVKLS